MNWHNKKDAFSQAAETSFKVDTKDRASAGHPAAEPASSEPKSKPLALNPLRPAERARPRPVAEPVAPENPVAQKLPVAAPALEKLAAKEPAAKKPAADTPAPTAEPAIRPTARLHIEPALRSNQEVAAPAKQVALEAPPAERVEPVMKAEPVAKEATSVPIGQISVKPKNEVTEQPADGKGKGGGRDKKGGGGRGGGGAPLQNRSIDKDFREVLTKGLSACRRNLVIVAVFSLFSNLLVLAIPVYLFNVSDRVYTSRSIDTLIMLTVVVVGAIGAQVFLDMMRRLILMRTAVEVECRLGSPVLSAAAKTAQSGSSREFQTLADLQQLRNFITGPVLLTMLDAPIAPIYMLVIFLIHPHIGFIVATTGTMLLTVAFLNQRMTAVPFARANGFAARANLQADAMARNAQVINAMGMIPEGVLMWGRETAESLKAQVVAQDRNVYLTGVSKFIRLCTQVAVLAWGAFLSLDHELTGGMVIAASIVGSRALAPLEGTIEGWRSFIHAKSSYARIRALLQNSPLNMERLILPRPLGRLNVDRVLYVPPPNKKVILNGITFQLEPGEVLGVVGASGSGKSTLARMLVGSITPTAGNVRLDMMDLRNWDPRQFGENVGYLPQDVQLFPATIKANIGRMRDDASDEAIFDAAELADVHEMISEFPQGYETMVAMDGSPLSGGQKQRIGLARAFFGDPRLVVLDEPNSNLDVAGEQALARAILRAKAKGITIVAITQRPALLRSVDKILVIKQGTAQAMGKRDDILALLSGRKDANGKARSPDDLTLPDN